MVIIVPHRITRSWYTGCWWVGCYIRYSEEGTDVAAARPGPSKCNSPPINGHCTNYHNNGPLLCSFNAPIKGLMMPNNHVLVWFVVALLNPFVKSLYWQQEAQLSQTDRAMLRLIKYFTKSLKITQTSFVITPVSWAYGSPYLYFIETVSVSGTISEKSSVKYWHDLEIWVRGRSRSLKMTSFDRSYTTYCWSAIVSISILYNFWVIWRWIISWSLNVG